MTKAVLVVLCLAISYVVVFLLVSNHWGQALMYAALGSIVFSSALLLASLIVGDCSWSTFWVTNALLIFLFGGAELYAGLTSGASHSARFGGMRLWVDGHITAAGIASIALDIAICVAANFGGFYTARYLMDKLGLQAH